MGLEGVASRPPFVRDPAVYRNILNQDARWSDVPQALKTALINAADVRDLAACNTATFQLYGLSHQEKAALGGNGD